MTDFPRKYFLYRLIWNGLDLLFPPICGGCGRLGSRWCDECQQGIVRISKPYCEICGIPLINTQYICPDCVSERPQFRCLRSWTAFDGTVQSALHRLKYRHDIGLGDALAVQFSRFVADLNWHFDLIVPVPLSRRRQNERGYNQVDLIARPLSLSMNIKYSPNALSRERETRSQVGLTKLERHVNVQGLFKLKKRK